MSAATERLTAWLNAAEELAKSNTVNRDEFHVACVGGMTGPLVRAALSLDDVAEVLILAAERDKLLALLRWVRSDRPSAHSDKVWAAINEALGSDVDR